MNSLLKHKLLILLLLFIPVLALGSCRKSRTVKPLSQLKREQRRAIDRLIRTENLRIVERNSETLPDNPDPNVYYHLSNGVYLRVLKAGGERPKANQTIVAVSMKGYFFNDGIPKDAEFDNLGQPGFAPLYFRYISTYTSEGTLHFDQIPEDSSFGGYSSILCEGLAFPMAVLGDGAEVAIIIPFERGPASNYTSGSSIYVQRAIYQFYHKPKQ